MTKVWLWCTGRQLCNVAIEEVVRQRVRSVRVDEEPYGPEKEH